MPFRHLTQYCKTKTAIEMAKVNKTLASPTCIRYKVGIQVSRGIKNAIELDRKNGNTHGKMQSRLNYSNSQTIRRFWYLIQGRSFLMAIRKFPII